MINLGTTGGHFARLAVLLLCGAGTAAAQPAGEKLPEAKRLPVLAWLGPPAEQSTAERMQELADAGFTESFSHYPTVDSARGALDAAHTAGVKLWIALPALRRDPESTVPQLQNHPALAGYFLADEPNADQFERLAAWAARIRAVDAAHPCYVNLFPNYATSEQTGTKSYREYLERFVRDVPELPISFDYYPIVGDQLREGWYGNLQRIADAARAARRPFWAFALSVAHDPYPVPTAAQLRLQVYTDLAYGAQTIQYFTYWTPPANPNWDFHSAPINRQGKRTVVYDRVKEVNAELKNLSLVFVGSTVESVGHTGSQLPPGTERYQPAGPVVELKAESGAVVSHLSTGDRRYLVAVNRSFSEPMDLAVTLDPAVPSSLVTKDGRLHPVVANRYQATVPAGDVAIFTWAARSEATSAANAP